MRKGLAGRPLDPGKSIRDGSMHLESRSTCSVWRAFALRLSEALTVMWSWHSDSSPVTLICTREEAR